MGKIIKMNDREQFDTLLTQLKEEKVSIFSDEVTTHLFTEIFYKLKLKKKCDHEDIVDSLFLSGVVFEKKIMINNVRLVMLWVLIQMALEEKIERGMEHFIEISEIANKSNYHHFHSAICLIFQKNLETYVDEEYLFECSFSLSKVLMQNFKKMRYLATLAVAEYLHHKFIYFKKNDIHAWLIEIYEFLDRAKIRDIRLFINY